MPRRRLPTSVIVGDSPLARLFCDVMVRRETKEAEIHLIHFVPLAVTLYVQTNKLN